MCRKFLFITIAGLIFSSFSCTSKKNLQDELNIEPLNFPGFGIGINIGNTLDSIGTHTWFAGETGWGNPLITHEFIKSLKAHGYKTVRLPVSWADYMGEAPDYIIKDSWLRRVKEVVDWIVGEDLYCILNIHHDGGGADKSWIRNMSVNEDIISHQFETVWKQIAIYFNNVSEEKLIFESMNEVGFDDLWSRWGGMSGKNEAYRKFNLLNQIFVDTVRAAGGNNTTRKLLIAGYDTDIELSTDFLFQMPADTTNGRLLISIHYYTPSTFCIAEEPDNSWGFRNNWGSDADYAELRMQFYKLKTSFIDKGYPVILGEYGVTKRNKDEESRLRWMIAVTQICLDYGICPVLWDTGAENGSGEIQRKTPFKMSDTLRLVINSLTVPK
jgi:endoglucanase